MTWRTMDTAPKDGTKVLLWCDRMKDAVIGYFVDRQTINHGVQTDSAKRWQGAGFDLLLQNLRPSYWRPLPKLDMFDEDEDKIRQEGFQDGYAAAHEEREMDEN